MPVEIPEKEEYTNYRRDKKTVGAYFQLITYTNQSCETILMDL